MSAARSNAGKDASDKAEASSPDRGDRAEASSSDGGDKAGSLEGGSSRRRRRQAKMKANIFETAVDLFAERGYDQVTVEEIATAADVAKGTFFNYFPTKDHLLVEYRGSLLDFIHAYGAALEGNSGREMIKQYFSALARRVSDEGERYSMLFKEVAARPRLFSLDTSRQGVYRGYFDRFISTGRIAGEIPESCDTQLLAETIRDIWTGTSVIWLLEQPSASLEELVLAKLDLLFDLLAATARAER